MTPQRKFSTPSDQGVEGAVPKVDTMENQRKILKLFRSGGTGRSEGTGRRTGRFLRPVLRDRFLRTGRHRNLLIKSKQIRII